MLVGEPFTVARLDVFSSKQRRAEHFISVQ
jgi:hypothetical protein